MNVIAVLENSRNDLHGEAAPIRRFFTISCPSPTPSPPPWSHAQLIHKNHDQSDRNPITSKKKSIRSEVFLSGTSQTTQTRVMDIRAPIIPTPFLGRGTWNDGSVVALGDCGTSLHGQQLRVQFQVVNRHELVLTRWVTPMSS